MDINTEEENRIILDFSLARITFLNTPEKEMLSKIIDNADKLALLSVEEIGQYINRTIGNKAVWDGKKNLQGAIREFDICRKMKINWLKWTDLEYPVMLKQIVNPPYLLFYRGALECFRQKSVSVVGTRKISAMGKLACLDFSKTASEAGVCVISGLANGTDSFAHKGCVEAYFNYLDEDKDISFLGKTCAVLPCGIDDIVPKTNVRLAEGILQSGGCLISEYAPLTPMADWHFVKRNRIIAALSPATVIIEAPNGSGALITADFALELGRDVLFHEVCFSKNAELINESVKKDLDKGFVKGTVSKHKIESSSLRYVEDGAPVIKDYDDFCKSLEEVPGFRSCKNIKQLSLFE
ncbi:MAG: DNA-protecting protein DprA [Treponema sp.]|nr:DNA-protecting protein DprA [Treponema sp.]